MSFLKPKVNFLKIDCAVIEKSLLEYYVISNTVVSRFTAEGKYVMTSFPVEMWTLSSCSRRMTRFWGQCAKMPSNAHNKTWKLKSPFSNLFRIGSDHRNIVAIISRPEVVCGVVSTRYAKIVGNYLHIRRQRIMMTTSIVFRLNIKWSRCRRKAIDCETITGKQLHQGCHDLRVTRQNICHWATESVLRSTKSKAVNEVALDCESASAS